jgi:fluoride exporter
MQTAYIAFFGALGCVSRYWLSSWTNLLTGKGFPFGTLLVNVVGSFLLGLLLEGSLRNSHLSIELRMGIAVGLLGGFTTFSTFSYETLRLVEQGSLWQASLNIGLNVSICIVFVALGIYLARQWT